MDAGRDGQPERFGGDQAPDLRIRRSPLRVGPFNRILERWSEWSTRSPAAFAPTAEATRWRHGCSLRRHCPNDEPAACRWAIVRSRSSFRSVRGSAMANASVTKTPTAAQAVVGVFLCPPTPPPSSPRNPALAPPATCTIRPLDRPAESNRPAAPRFSRPDRARGQVGRAPADRWCSRCSTRADAAWHNVCVKEPRRTMRRRRIWRMGL